jgi:hypothetical protein
MIHYTKKDSSWLTINMKSQATIHSTVLLVKLFCNFAASYSNIGATVRYCISEWYGVRSYDSNAIANNIFTVWFLRTLKIKKNYKKGFSYTVCLIAPLAHK